MCLTNRVKCAVVLWRSESANGGGDGGTFGKKTKKKMLKPVGILGWNLRGFLSKTNCTVSGSNAWNIIVSYNKKKPRNIQFCLVVNCFLPLDSPIP